MDLIKALWHGDVPLSTTFWLFGFGVNLLLTIALLYLTFQVDTLTNINGVIFYFMLLLFSILYGPFVLIAIWRSANKYQGLQRNAIAANIMVVIGWGKYFQSLAELAKEFSG